MKIIYAPRFSKAYKKLSFEIQDKAEAKEIIFRKDPFDSRLKTHKLHGKLAGSWAFSVDYEIRIIFIFKDFETVRFELIGDHDLY